jgi:microcystin degradation protein MlrC
MRIGIAQLWQETNTFNPAWTTAEDFGRFGVLRGSEIVQQLADTNELGGFIQSLRQWPERPEIVPLVRLPAWPSGPVTPETLEWLTDEMVRAVRAALPLDGMLLALHGAMVATGTPDVEGHVLGAIRAAVGYDLPIVATLDLHAHVTAPMAREANALVLYHTAPHIDVFETGQRGAALLRKLLIGLEEPVTALVRIPAVLPAENANTQDTQSPSYAVRQRLAELEAAPHVLTAGVATVQPWLDVPGLGTVVVVVANRDEELARKAACELAQQVWDARERYRPKLVGVQESVARAHQLDQEGVGLVVLSDAADATTSGACGDSNVILRELIQYEWKRGAVVTLVAPEMEDHALDLGVGRHEHMDLGGMRDPYCEPIILRVEVKNVFHAKFTMSGHLAKNLAIDMGPAAVLRHKDVLIVCTTHSGPHFAPHLFRAAGIDPFGVSVLVAKSPCGFRAAYAEMAREIMVVKSTGCAPPNYWEYPYRNIDRPLWPWDAIEGWQPQAEIFRRHA